MGGKNWQIYLIKKLNIIEDTLAILVEKFILRIKKERFTNLAIDKLLPFSDNDSVWKNRKPVKSWLSAFYSFDQLAIVPPLS